MNNIVALENGVEIHLPDGFVMSNLVCGGSDKNTRVIFNIEEPKKTLWDKRTRINDGYFELPDVKEALKEFIDYLQDGMDTEDMPRADWCVQLKAKEIFGEELVK